MADRTCSTEDCSHRVLAVGLCSTHYRWQQREKKRVAALGWLIKAPCSIAGCSHLAVERGWCYRHHGNWRMTGDPTIRPSNGFITAAGYLIVSAADHPLADKQGRVFKHRLVLWDKIGSGEHPCHWCGKTVSWDKSYPTDEDALVVDHLDFDRLNNRSRNLNPSDAVCNLLRYRKAS